MEKIFDSSYDRGQPFVFKIGHGQAIKGWDQDLLRWVSSLSSKEFFFYHIWFRICQGEHRKLIFHLSFSCGDVGAGGVIPPEATLLMGVICDEIERGTDS